MNVDVKEQRTQQFNSVFVCIRDDMRVFLERTMPKEVVEWFLCNVDSNVTEWDHIMYVVDLMAILHGRTLSDDEYFKASLLGWCIKFLEVSRIRIYSDDKSQRRPNQCWYAGDDIVIKDAYSLDAVIYYFLKKHFRTEKYYVHLTELFHEATFQAELGQLVNLTTTLKNHVDLDKFSLDKHALIARNGGASYYLLVAVSMCVCGVPESYAFQRRLFYPYTAARSIAFQLGEYIQVQKDFLNYLVTNQADEWTTSDIATNKCSWCINAVLSVASPEQRKVLEANYGRMDPEKEMRVREIYEAIGLKEQFRVYEARLRERIEGLIAEVQELEWNVDETVLKRDVFTFLLNKFTREHCKSHGAD